MSEHLDDPVPTLPLATSEEQHQSPAAYSLSPEMCKTFVVDTEPEQRQFDESLQVEDQPTFIPQDTVQSDEGSQDREESSSDRAESPQVQRPASGQSDLKLFVKNVPPSWEETEISDYFSCKSNYYDGRIGSTVLLFDTEEALDDALLFDDTEVEGKRISVIREVGSPVPSTIPFVEEKKASQEEVPRSSEAVPMSRPQILKRNSNTVSPYLIMIASYLFVLVVFTFKSK
ncbi:hypothetical protein RCL1_003945 [Eukaryota sp. TZLM3-RCL]